MLYVHSVLCYCNKLKTRHFKIVMLGVVLSYLSCMGFSTLFYYQSNFFYYFIYFSFFVSVRDWIALIPPTVVVGGVSYYAYQSIKRGRVGGKINPMIRLNEKKVVDFVEIEDIGEKMAFTPHSWEEVLEQGYPCMFRADCLLNADIFK